MNEISLENQYLDLDFIENEEIKELIEKFNDDDFEIAYEAIEKTINLKETTTPIFLQIINTITENYKANPDRIDCLIILFLLAKFREEKAHEYIIKLASFSEKWVDSFFGDIVTESLAKLIVSTYNGDISIIKKLIENKEAYLWCRIAAINAIPELFVQERISRDEVVHYFGQLIDSNLINDNSIITSYIINHIIDLYPGELYEKILELIDKNRVDIWINKSQVEKAMQMGKDECLKTRINAENDYKPVDDVIKEIDWMYSNKDVEDEDCDDNDYGCSCGCENNATYVRIAPKIGRNDPCICNSNKKYKKCCLN